MRAIPASSESAALPAELRADGCQSLGTLQAALLGSLPLLLWFGTVLAVNAVCLPLIEEPGLRHRFGEDYDTYRANVPRWVPRLRPWDPAS